MMKTTMMMIFAIILSLNLPAQERAPRERMTPEQQANQAVERMNKELQLTEKQQADLKTHFTGVFTKRQQKMEQHREKREQMREKMQEEMKKEQENTDAQLKKILTPAQYQKYQENQKKRKEHMKKRGSRRMMPNGGPGR